MPTLPTKSFQTMVADTVAGIQGRASKLINFSVGSTLRAIAEGFAGLFLWFQALVLQLLAATRLATSQGLDVDTFTADFMPVIPGSQTSALPNGSPRLGAQAASGTVTFGRFTAAPVSCFIPVGASLQSSDGQQDYAVTADTANSSYSAALGGYTLAANVATLDVPVAALVPGSAGNAAIGGISVLRTAITGIDYVRNGAAFTNGADFEQDSALKKRFSDYILGLARGDIFGLTAAIEGMSITIQWTLTENYNLDGSARYGYFFVVADDGSGSPSTNYLAGVLNVVNSVRPLGVQCQVFAPTVITANVSMQITTATGYDHNTVVAQVIALITSKINGLGLGNPLPFTLLTSWAYSVPGVVKVAGVQLNGNIGDAASISATRTTNDGYSQIADRTIKAGTVAVS